MALTEISVQDAECAMREFRCVIDEAHDMATAGAVGAVLDETLRHAEDFWTLWMIPSPMIIRYDRGFALHS
jgi:hypothetical protein